MPAAAAVLTTCRERPLHLAGLGGHEPGLRELGGDGGDRDGVIEADADHEVVALGGEVVGHRQLLGRGARDAQLGLVAGPRHCGTGLGEHGRITPGRRVHDHHDPPLGSGRGGLRAAEDGEREQPGDEEEYGESYE